MKKSTLFRCGNDFGMFLKGKGDTYSPDSAAVLVAQRQAIALERIAEALEDISKS